MGILNVFAEFIQINAENEKNRNPDLKGYGLKNAR